MFTISMKKLRKRIYCIHHKNNEMGNGSEKLPKKIKVKLLHDLLWNEVVQKFPQRIKRLLNIPTVGRD